MKHAKHTPGPWTLGISTRGPKFDEYDRVNAAGQGICLLDRHPGNITEANARLIAAAPELLEALLALINDYSIPPNALDSSLREDHLIIQARAAITKATGDVKW